MKAQTIKEVMAHLGAKGGSKRSEAQSEARKANAEKARKVKQEKRDNGVEGSSANTLCVKN